MIKFNLATKTAFGFVLFAYFVIVVQPWNLYFLNDDFVHIPLSTKTILVHFDFFRPIPNIITSLEMRFFGTNAVAFHCTSLVLHLIGTLCVAALSRHIVLRYGGNVHSTNAAYIAGCLFFVYPFHSEPTMWIIGRIAIIATIFSVSSIIFFLMRSKGYLFIVLSLTSFLLALFTYETSWVIPAMLTILAIADNRGTTLDIKNLVRKVAPYWVLLGLFLMLRYLALERLVTEYEIVGRNKSIVSIAGNFFRLLGRTLAPPAQDSRYFIGLSTGVLLVLTIVFLFLFRQKKINRSHLVLVTLLVLSYLPVLQIGIDTHGTEGERYVYFASVFWIILLTVLLTHFSQKMRTLTFVALILLYSILLAEAAAAYRHASKVAKHVLSLFPNSCESGKVIAINLPSNYKGALIFRSGFPEALRWIHACPDSVKIVVMPAKRTYNKVNLAIEIKSKIDAKNIKLAKEASDKRFYTTHPEADSLDYNAEKDVILYFTEENCGTIVYPSGVKQH